MWRAQWTGDWPPLTVMAKAGELDQLLLWPGTPLAIWVKRKLNINGCAVCLDRPLYSTQIYRVHKA
jgi:hypothetical protein